MDFAPEGNAEANTTADLNLKDKSSISSPLSPLTTSAEVLQTNGSGGGELGFQSLKPNYIHIL